jgi:anti-sigma-K factor RskA
MDRDTFFDLIPAYALGVLDADERTEFEALLSADPEARRLLAEYQAVAEALVLTVLAIPAPAHLQVDLRQRLAHSRGTTPSTQAIPPQKSRILLLRPLAAVAAIILVLGAVLFWSATRVNAPNDVGAQLFAEIAAHETARRIALAPSEGHDELAGELITTADGSQAVIEVWRLPPLEADSTFELWLIDDSGARSAGTFQTENPDGPTYIVVPLADERLDDFDAVGVSIEPAGGSPEQGPTGPRVFGVSVNT